MGVRKFFSLFLVLCFFCALQSPLEVFAGAAGNRFRSDVISSDTRWDADRYLTSDVVVGTGATLTITEGVVISARSDIPDAHPSPLGYSQRIEIIVDLGGRLEIEPGATLTALTDAGWGGIIFLAGSFGKIDGAVIRRAARGILVEDASPVIKNSRLEQLEGDDAIASGAPGMPAVGILVSGARAAPQIKANVITQLKGGNGAAGLDGLGGMALQPGAPGQGGQSGGRGGDAYGIMVQNDAFPEVFENIIDNIYSGSGGDGGAGGDGGIGVAGVHPPGDGGVGGNGGRGGNVGAIYVALSPSAAKAIEISNNIIGQIMAGGGGAGGPGGSGGSGQANQPGAPGGAGGAGGAGGDAIGIIASGGVDALRSNRMEILIISGQGGNGGAGGRGGQGGPGEVISSGA